MKTWNWINIRLILIFGVVVFLFSFTSKRNAKRKVTNTHVVFVGENSLFLKKEAVNKLLIENKLNTSSIGKDKLALNKIEKLLNSNALIEKSDVFVGIDGKLKAVVKQKTPVARFLDGYRSFYVDNKGDRMPLSYNFTARVLLFSGKFDKKNQKELAQLFQMIYEDEFLKKNIVEVRIMPNESLKMFNRNYNFQIDFGRMMNVEDKFKNYKAFFQKAIFDNKLSSYKKIDLRFTKQVVCTK